MSALMPVATPAVIGGTAIDITPISGECAMRASLVDGLLKRGIGPLGALSP
jgi:hypothetical protein